jgi:IS1 family transposase
MLQTVVSGPAVCVPTLVPLSPSDRHTLQRRNTQRTRELWGQTPHSTVMWWNAQSMWSTSAHVQWNAFLANSKRTNAAINNNVIIQQKLMRNKNNTVNKDTTGSVPMCRDTDRCMKLSTQPCNLHRQTLAVEWRDWTAQWLSLWHRNRKPPFQQVSL